jgi:hypothetical protein
MAGVGIGISPYLRRFFSSGALYRPDAQAYFDRVATEGGNLTDLEKGYINTYFGAIDITKYDRLWIHGLSNQIAARVSLANPSTADLLTEVNSPTWTAYLGYTGDGATEYLDYNFDLLNDGVEFTLNDASMGVYLNTNSTLEKAIMGVISLPSFERSYLYPQFSGAPLYSINSTVETLGSAPVNLKGLLMSTRLTSNSIKYFIDGTEEFTDITASVAIPSGNVYGLCRSFLGAANDFNTATLSMTVIGSTFDQAAFNTATQTLATNLGFNA